MGPRLLSRGKVLQKLVETDAYWLQWGRGC